MHKKMKHMAETLACAVENQLCNLDQADTKELGEAIDMIKDLQEAIYYETITKAMNQKEEEGYWDKAQYDEKYFDERYPHHDPYMTKDRDMDRHERRMYYPYSYNRMYYDGDGRSQSGNNNSNTNNSSNGNSTRNYSEREFPMEMHDAREGRSPKNRRMYMEAKESHQEKSVQFRELEKYMQELSQDIIEMINDASAEEKQYLEKKLTTLASKVSQMK